VFRQLLVVGAADGSFSTTGMPSSIIASDRLLLQKMAKAATSQELKQALQEHLEVIKTGQRQAVRRNEGLIECFESPARSPVTAPCTPYTSETNCRRP